AAGARRRTGREPGPWRSDRTSKRMRLVPHPSPRGSPMPQEHLLSTLFGFWREVAAETIRCLGEGTASLFLDLYNDALNIQGAVLAAYPEEERPCSLVFADFAGLLKELHWLHALFLFGNYPFVLSRLRHDWEWLFRAYHADTYAQHNPGATDVPGPTLDD